MRKIALPTTIVIFCVLIGLSAYLAAGHLKTIQERAAQRIDASDVQSDIAAVGMDLESIETGQRGYLLTGDEAYLAPYKQATEKLPTHFSRLKSRLAARPAEERSIESEVESVAQAKIADADETIRLRQKGYRHRAFLIVDSNRGKELMDQARSLLDRLSAAESNNVAEYDRQLGNSILTARTQAVLAAAILLALTVITLFAFHRSARRLEVAYAKQSQELRSASERVERFTSTLSENVRDVATQMRSYAENLLSAYGGFLPRQGQEKAEWIHEGSCEINRLLDELLEPPSSKVKVEAAGREEGPLGKPPQPAELSVSEQPRSHTA